VIVGLGDYGKKKIKYDIPDQTSPYRYCEEIVGLPIVDSTHLHIDLKIINMSGRNG